MSPTHILPFILVFLSPFVSIKGVFAAPVETTKAFEIAVIGDFSDENFKKEWIPFFEKNSRCKNCQLVNLTPYDEKQNPIKEKFWKTLIDLSSEYPLIYLHYNQIVKGSEQQSLVDQINKKLNGDFTLVAYAGHPENGQPTVALKNTFLGQIHQALIISELTERERLLPHLFYGPEILMAVTPPKEYLGRELSPLMFLGPLADQYKKRRPSDWPEYLQKKRSQNKKIWPSVNDFF